MPPFGPIKRTDLIRALRGMGFSGPFSGKRHQYMIREQTRLTLPNPHVGDIGRDLLGRILGQAGISKEDWERA